MMLIRSSEHLQCAVGVLGLTHHSSANGCLLSLCDEGVKVIPDGSKEVKRIINN